MSKLSCESTLSGHNGRVWDLSWSPSGDLLASCGEDTNIRLWAREGDQFALQTILSDGHTRTVRGICWSPCGNFLASASFDGTISIWDRKQGQFECSATLEGHENEVKGVSFSPSGHFLATCSRDKSVWVWDVDEEEYTCASVLQSHSQDVKKVRFHPHTDLLASCSYDNTVKMYREEGDDWECLHTINAHDNTVWSIAFDKSGERLVSVCEDGSLKIFGLLEQSKGWKCLVSLTGMHDRAIYDVDWSRGPKELIATACGDDGLRVFRVKDDDNVAQIDLVAHQPKAHQQDLNCVKFNPKDESLLATCSDDGLIKLWRCQFDPMET